MPPKRYPISQEAFDAAVKENEELFDMDKEEAIKDAITALELQGVDLTGIITTLGPREIVVGESSVAKAVRRLNDAVRALDGTAGGQSGACETVLEVEGLPDGGSTGSDRSPAGKVPGSGGVDLALNLTAALEDLRLECGKENRGDLKSVVAEARKAGIVESVVRASLSAQAARSTPTLAAALHTLLSLLQDGENRDVFYDAGGCKLVASVIESEGESPLIAELGLISLAAAATKHEAAKEHFMDLGAHRTCVALLRRHEGSAEVVGAACEAMRVLVTPDDDRAPSSKAFGNARNLAKAGAVEAILAASSGLRTNQTAFRMHCLTLKAVAVNDEICKSVAEHGGIALTLSFADQCARQPNKAMGKATCALLCQLAGSDSNKDAIVEGGGLERLVELCSVYGCDPPVLQEALAAIAALTLRSSKNAGLALNAGAVDAAVTAMETHARATGVQRHACSLIRNLAVRNPENRLAILEKGVEPLIRKLKAVPACRDAATAALRDLGFNDYNDN